MTGLVRPRASPASGYGYENERGAEDNEGVTRREHCELYEAIAEGDAAAAERVIESHFNRAADTLRHVLERSGEVLADVSLETGPAVERLTGRGA